MTAIGLQFHVLFIYLAFSNGLISSQKPPICCYPKQYEAFVFAVQGDVNVESANSGEPTSDSSVDLRSSGRMMSSTTKTDPGKVGYGYGYANGTLRIAYDAINLRTYIHESAVEFLSIYPIPVPLTSANLLDYKNNVQWRMYGDGTCDQMEVGYDFFEECIPGNATLVSRGTLGDSTQLTETYFFRDRIYLDPYEITVTVMRSADNSSQCRPIRMTTSQAYVFDSNKNVDISVADILDFTEGIKDTSIFKPPAVCKNNTRAVHAFHSKRPARQGLLATVMSIKHMRPGEPSSKYRPEELTGNV